MQVIDKNGVDYGVSCVVYLVVSICEGETRQYRTILQKVIAVMVITCLVQGDKNTEYIDIIHLSIW